MNRLGQTLKEKHPRMHLIKLKKSEYFCDLK